jgi:predicted AAA+ superfamily ATPase
MLYTARIVDAELTQRLAATGAVVIEGPKACGKTETARQLAASEVRLDVDDEARRAVSLDPTLILDGPTPRLIDEWQIEPALWNHIRRAVDDRREPGQFILTGSAIPTDDITRHSGAGRITRFRMRPMTLFETGRSEGGISLSALLEGEKARSTDPGVTVAEIASEISIGGWPGIRDTGEPRALQALRDYLGEIARVGVSTVSGVTRDPEKVKRLLRSVARNTATHAAATTLAADTKGSDGALKDDTVRAYLDALTRLMVVEDQPAWAPHLRSKYVMRRAPKRHFVDPSLAVGALRASAPKLLEDLNLLGFLFESLVVRDLRVYAQAADGVVLQYRDSEGLEVDAVIETGDGRWAAFEIKLGSNRIEEGASNLLKFAKQIDTKRCGKPAALGVIVGNGYGYRREDGIYVIPIGALGP